MVKKDATELLKDLPLRVEISGELPTNTVSDVVFDSRQVVPQCIFVAVQGGNVDGHDYIMEAVRRGAKVIVGTKPAPQGLSTAYIRVDNSREALAYLSAALFGHPARDLTVIGVTGTDGKTTTCNLLYQILIQAGFRAGMVTSVNAVLGDEVVDTGYHVTTPEAPDIQKYLYRMKEDGLTHVVLEATSHGLAQHRLTGCEFDIGIVTNITHEHLDYHGNYESYRNAKAILFSNLLETATKPAGNIRMAVLNRDDRSYPYLHEGIPARQVCYGLKPGADVWARDVQHKPAGISFMAVGDDFQLQLSSPLVGLFNVANILAAFTAAVKGLQVDPTVAGMGVASLKGVSGRMESIDMGQRFSAIVDFAHTPNALQRALETARELTAGRVIAVFGSAGLRDRQKRKLMSAVSAKLADITVITAEDPRTEKLEHILMEMETEAVKHGASLGEDLFCIPDRGRAIRFAVGCANPADLVLVCGKGHEQSMCFGEVEFPWDDRVALKAALADLLGKEGPAMPYLPTSGQNNIQTNLMDLAM